MKSDFELWGLLHGITNGVGIYLYENPKTGEYLIQIEIEKTRKVLGSKLFPNQARFTAWIDNRNMTEIIDNLTKGGITNGN